MTFMNDIGLGRLRQWTEGDDASSDGDRVRRAGEDIPPRAPRAGHPIGANTGFVPIDVLSDCLDRVAAPFASAPPPEQGAWGAIAQYAGGVMGLISAPAEIFDTATSQIPVPSIMELMPFPAAIMASPHIGTPHAHTHPPSFVPPAPPIPLPSFGMPVAAGCASVLIGGVPALRAGDLGLGLTCVSAAPAFEVMTGSRTVFIGGSRAARMGDITFHCNPIALATVATALMDAANVGVGLANTMAHQSAAAELAASAEDLAQQADEADGAASAALAAEAAGLAAQAAGQAAAATTAAAQAALDGMSAGLKALLGTDVGIAPGVGMVAMGWPTVLIGGAPLPSASLLVGELRRAFARRSCRSRSRCVRWLGSMVGTPDCA